MKINDLLNEAIKYDDMFQKVFAIFDKYDVDTTSSRATINSIFKQVKTDLTKEDRVVWFMRLYKIWFLEFDLPRQIKANADAMYELHQEKVKTVKKAKLPIDDYLSTMRTPAIMMSHLRHFLSLPVPKIQNFVFGTQTYEDIWSIFSDYENEWKLETRGLLSPQEGDKIVVKFNDNTAWWLLARGACKEEAEAMGHCGNVPSVKSGERILSFRTKKAENLWQPHLTFILDDEGRIGEAKGKGNNKPTEKYHPYIAKLLSNEKIVKGIKGGGYAPENNFKFNDLSDDLKNKVIENNPNIKEASMSIWEKYKTYGLTSEVKSKVEDYLDRLFTSYMEWDEENNNAIVEQYNDLQTFANEINFDLLDNALKVLEMANEEPDLDELENNFFVIPNDYKDILDNLPEKYLNKIKKSVDYTGNNLGDLSEMLDKSKYGPELRKAMLNATETFGSNFNKEEYMKYINVLLTLYVNSSGNYHAYMNEIDTEDDYIKILMPIDDIITLAYLVEFMNDNDDIHEAEYADEEDISIYYDISNERTALPVDGYTLKDNVSDAENYLGEDDFEIFQKYKDYVYDDTEITGISQNFDIMTAVGYFTKYIDLNESKDMTRLKSLAGIS
jgi:hypothetical protein